MIEARPPRNLYQLLKVGGRSRNYIKKKNKAPLFSGAFSLCRFKLFQDCRYIIRTEFSQFRANPVRRYVTAGQ